MRSKYHWTNLRGDYGRRFWLFADGEIEVTESRCAPAPEGGVELPPWWHLTVDFDPGERERWLWPTGAHFAEGGGVLSVTANLSAWHEVTA